MKSALNALCLAILCLCVLNGCVQPIVLENLGIAIALGYDAAQEAEQEDKLRVTAVLINPEPEAKQKTKVVSCTANSSKGANIYLNRQLSRTLVNGQVRVVLFDGKLGDQGIKEIADTLTRDLFIKKMAYPVSRGKD
ncbi:Ger(x)C family spore germination protein [Paenibacillus sp. OSY-SE]|uniref:Ger(x)C family spore germination protein n=1 Tax=Paenibacillus sp. OSY-SE TaxID=1196323 RepID=UPI0002D8913E|nr:hypothetical protein [Paenibacillus sp. OSY-SE]